MSPGPGALVKAVPDPSVMPALSALLNDPTVRSTWVFQGRHAPPDELARRVWEGTLLHYTFSSRHSGALASYAVVYDASFRDQRMKVAAAVAPSVQRSTVLVRSIATILAEAFDTWPFRFARIELPDVNTPHLAGGLRRFGWREEARLEDHYFVGGGFVDQVTWRIDRQRFGDELARLEGGLVV